LTVTVPPSFTTQPASTAVTAGYPAYFLATVSSAQTPSYQWEISTNGGQTWTTLTDGGGFVGSATDDLRIASPRWRKAAMNSS
jgi:hypothetical protein